MKQKHAFHNQKGFALMEVIAAMVILVITLIGMIVAMNYAHAKSAYNYRYRIALLKAESELQIIKMRHYHSGNFGSLASKEFNIQANPNSKPIRATVYFTAATINDTQVSLRTSYTSVTATVRWYEPSMYALYQSPNDYKEVILREDYYFERTQ
ncbi:MAG: hypothetical protein RBS16_03530 [Candidatus Cloacimonadales bacterium]|jgi:Tfp pilus assembly protein PilV|nr:hypothetical protein [Candidatus Cloacimonadota bacterium]MDD2650311.1 hypothetical protein [Candidatus Cloacimonadota bacterium]MDX9977084.1 hypothetical protein [Candidatus Cloacimonadales bacterium]